MVVRGGYTVRSSKPYLRFLSPVCFARPMLQDEVESVDPVLHTCYMELDVRCSNSLSEETNFSATIYPWAIRGPKSHVTP